MKKILTAVLASIVFFLPLMPAHAAVKHEVFFGGTDHELDVYRIYGRENGPTLMLMGHTDVVPTGPLAQWTSDPGGIWPPISMPTCS